MVSIGQSAASGMAKARAEASASGGGADIGPIMATGVPGMGLNVDGTRYFWFHHTDADTPDKLDRAEVQRCVAAMAQEVLSHLRKCSDRRPLVVAISRDQY